jgi:flagellar hook protein FlgE
MPSFSIALSGLDADAVALNTIGNNLANLNTTGFKEQTVNFSDLFYHNIGTSGSNAPLQVGSGTHVSSIDTNFTQGSVSSTGNDTDMAINGNGFFVVDQGGSNELTRSGNFQLSPTGDLITSDGYAVQGYPAVNGVANTNARITTINIPLTSTQLAHATQNFSLPTSLDAGAATGTQFTASSVMYDSLGTAHTVDVVFTKSGTSAWNYNVSMPSGDATTISGNTGTLTFNSDGTLATPTGNISGIGFAGLSDGASNMTLSWNLHDSGGNSLITQSAGTSTNSAISQDGYPSGTYKSFAVDASGIVTATYTNNSTQVLGQIAVATVSNQEALSRTGDNLYSTNAASGAINLGVAGGGGRGVIAGESLEGSNIDISTEFANLIVAQRSFEANSKTVTAFDTITQDTINMIR